MWIVGYHIYLIRISDSANVSRNQIMKESFHSTKQSFKLALFAIVNNYNSTSVDVFSAFLPKFVRRSIQGCLTFCFLSADW